VVVAGDEKVSAVGAEGERDRIEEAAAVRGDEDFIESAGLAIVFEDSVAALARDVEVAIGAEDEGVGSAQTAADGGYKGVCGGASRASKRRI
jgi:hypothetical protein